MNDEERYMLARISASISDLLDGGAIEKEAACQCDHLGLDCGKQSPTDDFICTRSRGHDGNHVACDTDEHGLEEWGQEANHPGTPGCRCDACLTDDNASDDTPVGPEGDATYWRARAEWAEEGARGWMATAQSWQETAEGWEATAKSAEREAENLPAKFWYGQCERVKIDRDAWMENAELATAERDEARRERDSWRAQVPLAEWEKELIQPDEQTRPLTADDFTDEMIERMQAVEERETGDYSTSALLRSMITAALTPPPPRPEGAEEIERLLTEDLGDFSPPATPEAIADLLAVRGVRVTGGDS